MTRATEKPVRRIVLSGDDRMGMMPMVAEVRDYTLTLRPLRTRSGGPQEVSLPWGAVYLRAMMARVEETKRAKRRGRRRR